jgi:hypothetical protein
MTTPRIDELRRPDVERIARLHYEALETDEVPWPPMSGGYASRAYEVFYAVPSLIAAFKTLERERPLLLDVVEATQKLVDRGVGDWPGMDEVARREQVLIEALARLKKYLSK